ncbi:hypothetical protein L083_2694 [Actinoplanes sp. N902-109]|nr:hypothetical protein L083_2694 [Actinoplanes sp. N902-109]
MLIDDATSEMSQSWALPDGPIPMQLSRTPVALTAGGREAAPETVVPANHANGLFRRVLVGRMTGAGQVG